MIRIGAIVVGAVILIAVAWGFLSNCKPAAGSVDAPAQIGFSNSVRLVFGGSIAFATGGQIILTSFVLSMLGLQISKRKEAA
jgi:hypothetical protein